MKNRIASTNITALKSSQIFVFGSNAAGDHAGGAAKLALEKFGAKNGQARGHAGKSYAIDTMSGLDAIPEQVNTFIAFYMLHLLIFCRKPYQSKPDRQTDNWPPAGPSAT